MFAQSKARAPEIAEHRSKWSRGYHWVIKLARCILKRGLEVVHFKIRHLFENLTSRETRGKKIQHIYNPNPHAADAGPAPTLLRICSNTVHQASHDAFIP